MTDLRDVLKSMRGAPPRTGGGGGPQGPRAAFWKKPKPGQPAQTTAFRLYRFDHMGKKIVCSQRTVHNTGFAGRPEWVPCAGEGCTICTTWQELRRMAFLDDLNKKAALDKADQVRPQTKFEFVGINQSNPVEFTLIELPEGAAKKVLLAAAKEAGWIGGYPEQPGKEATEEELQAAEAKLIELDEKTAQGLDVLCGPAGRDVAITVNPLCAVKSDWYTVDVVRGVPRTLTQLEDGAVPNPYETRERMEAARARKGQ